MNINLTKEQEEKLKNIKDVDSFIHLAINKQLEVIEIQKHILDNPEDFKGEIWKDIPNYEGSYQASNLGRIRSLDREIIKFDPLRNKTVRYKRNGGIVKINYHHSQYFIARLCKNGTNKTFNVHRLIAQTFIPNPENKPIVNHKNGIRTDNQVTNLEWMNNSENSRHAIDSGLTKVCKGESHGSSKFTNKQIVEMRELYKTGNYTYSEIGEKFNTNKSRVAEIVTRKTWKHI